MDKKTLIEEAAKKYAALTDPMAREFFLGYITGKRDEQRMEK